MKREYAIDKLIENADKCINMLDLCHKMGIEHVGGEDYKEIRELARELGLTLKFSYKRSLWSKSERKPINEILVENSEYKNTTTLKNRLLKEGIKENVCEICGINEWNGKPISLQIHHINGIHTDNRLENLMLLCPNCHSQTDTYAGKNTNKYISGTTRCTSQKRTMSKEEWENFRENAWSKNHPAKETLIEIFLQTGSFLQTGKVYGVSDNAIKKWFKHYGMPTKKKELIKYIQNSGQ